jgi:hypothetical protein
MLRFIPAWCFSEASTESGERFRKSHEGERLVGRDAGIRTLEKTSLFLGNSGMGAKMCPIAVCQLLWAGDSWRGVYQLQ